MASVISQPAADEGVKARQPNTGQKFACRCLRVSEQDVRQAITAGVACDLVDLMRHTGAGTGCMACRSNIRKIVESCHCESCDT